MLSHKFYEQLIQADLQRFAFFSLNRRYCLWFTGLGEDAALLII